MKKLLVVLLALALIFAFAACGQQAAPAEEEPAAEEGFTAIPLGGSLVDFPVTGDAYGVYQLVEMPEGALEEGVEGQLYYAEGSDTPYIAVYRWAKDGVTLEEEAAAEIETFGATIYQIANCAWNNDYTCAYYCIVDHFEDGVYYADCQILEDGDDFVVLVIYKATEEVALGESGQYLWLPVGYTDLLNEEEQSHGCLFYCEYSPEHYFPAVWVGPKTDSYAEECWFWNIQYPEGLPFDEATYSGWMEAGWDEAAFAAFDSAMGFENTIHKTLDVNGTTALISSFDLNGKHLDDIIFTVGDSTYRVGLSNELDPEPRYTKAIVESLHSK